MNPKLMDNDILINQARQLYVALQVEQLTRQSDRLDHLVISAYGRYQRRLNCCVLCYLTRAVDCDRYILGKLCPDKLSEQQLRQNLLNPSNFASNYLTTHEVNCHHRISSDAKL